MRSVLVGVVLIGCSAKVQTPAAPDADAVIGDSAVVAPPDAPIDAFDPTAGVDWFTWPEQQPGLADASWGVQLTDIARHLPAQYGDQYWFPDDGMTSGHETTHGIQAHLRNYEAPATGRYNAFYVLQDRAAFVEEPDMRKSDIAAFVPPSLRGDRYATYITGQTEWDDTPLYVFDEWVAYTNGAEVAVGQVQAGLYHAGWTDAVMGPLELVVYAMATAHAVSMKDPAYFASNMQFRRFTAWNISARCSCSKRAARCRSSSGRSRMRTPPRCAPAPTPTSSARSPVRRGARTGRSASSGSETSPHHC